MSDMAVKYNMAKKRKMAKGGMADCYADGGDVEVEEPAPADSFAGYDKSKAKKVSDSFMNMAEGGFVEEEDASGYHAMPEENADVMAEHAIPNQDHDATALDMVDSIMKMRSMAKGYAEGGAVANDTPPDVEFEDNQFDDMVKDDSLEGKADYTAENSGDEDGNEALDEEDDDVVDSVMKSRKKKDKLPNPR